MVAKMQFIFFRIFFLIGVIGSVCCFGSDYKKWWDDWYLNGGISGAGSRGLLAQYKADVINDFIDKHDINSVVEFGCGDGYVLKLMKYNNYLGLDVSKTAIKMCLEMFQDNDSKSFMLYDPNYFVNKTIKKFDLVVCLDVLYHIFDENDYLKLLDDIFSFSSKYIIIYTTLTDSAPKSIDTLHRNILTYLEKYKKDYYIQILKQRYKEISGSDFIFLIKKNI